MEKKLKKFYTAPDMDVMDVIVETALLAISGGNSEGSFGDTPGGEN